MIWDKADLCRAATLWRAGDHTLTIASALGVDEAEVWNRLDGIKALARAG
jgi:hypothetical protein